MPRSEYTDRQLNLIFASNADRERWRAVAERAQMPLTKWILATVETCLAGESEDAEEVATQRTSLQAENRKLRRDLEKSDARLKDLETELFKVRNQLFSIEQVKGHGSFDEKLLAVLRSGGNWSNRNLLAELGVESNDAEAIEIVTRQLQVLQDLGVVKESARGWKWVR